MKGFVHLIEVAVSGLLVMLILGSFFAVQNTAGDWTRGDLIEVGSDTFSVIEKSAIQNALRNNNGSVYKAAKELGLARQTLYNKMKKHDL